MKRSLNIPNDLDDKIKEYAEKNQMTFTSACIDLINLSFTDFETSNDLKKQLETLAEENENLKEDLKKEKEEKMEEYKRTIEENTKTNKALIDLMKAEKLLQIEAKTEAEKLGFFGKIKVLFSGKSKNKDNI